MARTESTMRVNIPPEVAFEMWSDLTRARDFLPSVLDAKRAGEGTYTLTLRTAEGKETTRVSYSVIEAPRRLVWRSKGGAKWNGEVIMRPTVDGTEIRLIIDYEPTALLAHPTERGSVVPTWNVGGDLLAFKIYAERVGAEAGETVGA